MDPQLHYVYKCLLYASKGYNIDKFSVESNNNTLNFQQLNKNPGRFNAKVLEKLLEIMHSKEQCWSELELAQHIFELSKKVQKIHQDSYLKESSSLIAKIFYPLDSYFNCNYFQNINVEKVALQSIYEIMLLTLSEFPELLDETTNSPSEEIKNSILNLKTEKLVDIDRKLLNILLSQADFSKEEVIHFIQQIENKEVVADVLSEICSEKKNLEFWDTSFALQILDKIKDKNLIKAFIKHLCIKKPITLSLNTDFKNYLNIIDFEDLQEICIKNNTVWKYIRNLENDHYKLMITQCKSVSLMVYIWTIESQSNVFAACELIYELQDKEILVQTLSQICLAQYQDEKNLEVIFKVINGKNDEIKTEVILKLLKIHPEWLAHIDSKEKFVKKFSNNKTNFFAFMSSLTLTEEILTFLGQNNPKMLDPDLLSDETLIMLSRKCEDVEQLIKIGQNNIALLNNVENKVLLKEALLGIVKNTVGFQQRLIVLYQIQNDIQNDSICSEVMFGAFIQDLNLLKGFDSKKIIWKEAYGSKLSMLDAIYQINPTILLNEELFEEFEHHYLLKKCTNSNLLMKLAIEKFKKTEKDPLKTVLKLISSVEDNDVLEKVFIDFCLEQKSMIDWTHDFPLFRHIGESILLKALPLLALKKSDLLENKAFIKLCEEENQEKLLNFIKDILMNLSKEIVEQKEIEQLESHLKELENYYDQGNITAYTRGLITQEIQNKLKEVKLEIQDLETENTEISTKTFENYRILIYEQAIKELIEAAEERINDQSYDDIIEGGENFDFEKLKKTSSKELISLFREVVEKSDRIQRGLDNKGVEEIRILFVLSLYQLVSSSNIKHNLESFEILIKRMIKEKYPLLKSEMISEELFEEKQKIEKLNFQSYLIEAEKDNLEAKYELARCYLEGIGTEKNDKLAFEWYKQCAEHGKIEAQRNLGAFYYNGYGIEKNLKLSFLWYYEAALAGDGEAEYQVSCFYYEGKGVKKDGVSAFEWCKKSAENSIVEAEFLLGTFYEKGIGVCKEAQKAFYWYKKGAEKDFAKAMSKMGDCYFFGYGTERNYNLAFQYYKKAAIKMDVHSWYQLGLCYEEGYGTLKNPYFASSWYKVAARQGEITKTSIVDEFKKALSIFYSSVSNDTSMLQTQKRGDKEYLSTVNNTEIVLISSLKKAKVNLLLLEDTFNEVQASIQNTKEKIKNLDNLLIKNKECIYKLFKENESIQSCNWSDKSTPYTKSLKTQRLEDRKRLLQSTTENKPLKRWENYIHIIYFEKSKSANKKSYNIFNFLFKSQQSKENQQNEMLAIEKQSYLEIVTNIQRHLKSKKEAKQILIELDGQRKRLLEEIKINKQTIKKIQKDEKEQKKFDEITILEEPLHESIFKLKEPDKKSLDQDLSKIETIILSEKHPQEIRMVAVNFLKEIALETKYYAPLKLLYKIKQEIQMKRFEDNFISELIFFELSIAIKEVKRTMGIDDFICQLMTESKEAEAIEWIKREALEGNISMMGTLIDLLMKKEKVEWMNTLKTLLLSAIKEDQPLVINYFQKHFKEVYSSKDAQYFLKIIDDSSSLYFIDEKSENLKNGIRFLIKGDLSEIKMGILNKNRNSSCLQIVDSKNKENFDEKTILAIPEQNYKDMIRGIHLSVNGEFQKQEDELERCYKTVLELIQYFNQKLISSTTLSSSIMDSPGYLYTKRLLSFIHQGLAKDAVAYLIQKYNPRCSDMLLVNRAPSIDHIFNVVILEDKIGVTSEIIFSLRDPSENALMEWSYVKVIRAMIIPLRELEEILHNEIVQNRSLEEILPNLQVKERYSRRYVDLKEIIQEENNNELQSIRNFTWDRLTFSDKQNVQKNNILISNKKDN